MFSRTIFFIFKVSIEASISKLVDLYSKYMDIVIAATTTVCNSSCLRTNCQLPFSYLKCALL